MIATVDRLEFAASALRAVGCRRVSMAGDRVRCTCVMAHRTHPKGVDSSPSAVVLVNEDTGDLYFTCSSCHASMSFRDLMFFLGSLFGGQDKAALDIGMSMLIDDDKSEYKTDIARRVHRMSARAERTEMSDRKRVRVNEPLPELPWSEYEPMLEHCEMSRRYLRDRGISDAAVAAWELGWSPWNKRVMFPVKDAAGRLVATSGRLVDPNPICRKCRQPFIVRVEGEKQVCACGDREPAKYMHSKGFKRNRMLYGEHLKAPGETVVYVVEGHLDAVNMWQLGYRSVVALFGSAPGDEQVERLVRGWSKIVVIADGDDAGRKLATEMQEMVDERVPVTAVLLPASMPGKRERPDPGNLTAEEARQWVGEPTKAP
jgi:hypothetical protein